MKRERIGGIVLCAGFGTRLQPITHEIPKPAIPFLGKPMVWYAVHALYRAGIRSVAANLCHLPSVMEECFRSVCAEVGMDEPIFYHEGGAIAGTAGGAAACARLLPECDRFVVYHGDVLSAADVGHALCEHEQSQCDVSLVVAPRPEASPLGLVETCRGEVVRIRDWRAPEDRTEVNASREARCFTGIHIIERRILEEIDPSRYTCLVTEIYPRMMASCQKIHAVSDVGFFADIGTPRSYLEAQNAVLQNPRILPGACIVLPSDEENEGNDVRCIPPVYIDESCRCTHAHIGPNVVLSHAACVDHVRLSHCACFGTWMIS